jgi:protein-tyrosine phosphatase
MVKFLLFLTAAALLCVGAVLRGGAWWLTVWPAASCVWIGIAYLLNRHDAFGKRLTGTLPAGRVLLLLPFLVYIWSIWSLLRLVLREPACHQILSDLWIGRRLLPREVPSGIERVLDLTAEFSEPAGVRDGREYIGRPLLDATAPSPQVIHEWVMELARRPGCLYIHCAQGHGRTGLLAAALLLQRGIASDAESAIGQLQAIRPDVRLNSQQSRCLSDFAELLTSTRAPPRDQPTPP